MPIPGAARKPDPLVSRALRLEARGRLGPQGEEIEPLNEADVLAAAAAFKAAARDLDTPLIWGGDWPRLRDGPHFELDRRAFP